MRQVPNFSAFPAALRSLPQWVLYDEKKIPLTVEGKKASSTSPGDWTTFDAAVAEFAATADRRIQGIGFVFASPPSVTGVDLDYAIDDQGDIKPWARKALTLIGQCYAEMSPSGHGIHCLVYGKKPGDKCRRVVANKDGEKLGGFEMYDHARYFTVTGNVIKGYTELVENQAAIDFLYKNVLDIAEPDTPPPANPNAYKAPSLSEQKVIELIEKSSSGEKFKLLYHGPIESALEKYDGDHSRAVHALTGLLAFWCDTFEVVDSIFQKSCLYSDKWLKKWSRLGLAGYTRQRGKLAAAGNVYSEDAGRCSPEQDFTDSDAVSAQDKGELEYERHVELLFLNYSEARRDLISDDLFVKSRKDGKWESAFCMPIIKSLQGECAVRGKKFKTSRIEQYLWRYCTNSPKQLLIDVPLWDKEDRIGLMCSKLNPKELELRHCDELLRDWMARMWQRIYTPHVQNRCIILSGKQGIGKDVWGKSLLYGLDKYLIDLTLQGQFTKETDLAIPMAGSIAMFISEFDKVKILGIETLKDLVTKESFNFVRKYDRGMSTLPNRCSIMGACNPEHVLLDYTGNRRFLVWKLGGQANQAIKWDYPTFDRGFGLQILAQARELAEADYHAGPEAEGRMAELTAEYTPDDPLSEIVFEFEKMIEVKISRDALGSSGLYRLGELDDELSSVCKAFGTYRNDVLKILKNAGCSYRNQEGRFYSTKENIKIAVELLAGAKERGFDEEGFH